MSGRTRRPLMSQTSTSGFSAASRCRSLVRLHSALNQSKRARGSCSDAQCRTHTSDTSSPSRSISPGPTMARLQWP